MCSSFVSSLLVCFPATGQFKDGMTARLPAQRLGEPEELANLAAYLVSDYASWVSGQIFTLDGGEVSWKRRRVPACVC